MRAGCEMAGDWIKMRIELQSHPKIVRILSATQSDKFRVIGGLHAAWSVFDTHSEDGKLHGYTPDLMDHVIGWPGFSGALVAVGWLVFDGAETLSMPEFVEHNGKSGKRRAEDQKRKRESRKCPQIVRNEAEEVADEKRTREEKRREDKNNTSAATPVGFAEFWSAYPKKVGKIAALKAWKRCTADLGEVLNAINRQKLGTNWTKDGGQYIPNPATWINEGRWEDEEPRGTVTPIGWTPPKTGDTRNHPMYGHPERFVEGVGWELAG